MTCALLLMRRRSVEMPLLLESGHLVAKHLGVDNATIADERRHALVHDA